MAGELQACQDPQKDVDTFLNKLLENEAGWAGIDPATKEQLKGLLCQEESDVSSSEDESEEDTIGESPEYLKLKQVATLSQTITSGDRFKSSPGIFSKNNETVTQSGSDTVNPNDGSGAITEPANVATTRATTSSVPSDIAPPGRSISSDVGARQVSVSGSLTSFGGSLDAERDLPTDVEDSCSLPSPFSPDPVGESSSGVESPDGNRSSVSLERKSVSPVLPSSSEGNDVYYQRARHPEGPYDPMEPVINSFPEGMHEHVDGKADLSDPDSLSKGSPSSSGQSSPSSSLNLSMTGRQ